MSKSTINVIIMFLSLLFFCGTIGLIITMCEIGMLTEEKTTELIATVIDTELTNTGTDVFAEIYTKEYDTSLLISNNICNYMETDKLSDLKTGDTIFFRIENANLEQINVVDFINIVSLRSDRKNIFSLKEYNEIMSISAQPAQVVSVIVAIFFLVVFLSFFFKFITKNRALKRSKL